MPLLCTALINRRNIEFTSQVMNSKSLCHIVAMPYPARGHSNPMMNLCKIIASRRHDILITFVTEERLGYSSSSDSYPPNLTFAHIPKDILPSEESHMADKLAFGNAVMTKMGAPFEQIVDALHYPATTILTDASISWAVDAANRRNIPVAALWVVSASELSIHCHLNLFREKQFPTDLEEHENDIVNFIPGITPIRVGDLPRFFFKNGQNSAIDGWKFNLPISQIQYLLCVSVYELESQVYNFLRAKFNFPIYPSGPLIPYYTCKSSATTPDYIEWLNSQPTSSVLYIAMGTVSSFSSDQMDEMVAGLKSSGVRFLWVGREDTSRLKDDCGDQGFVVPWCDQLRVFMHSSIGGYLTHCGLSSVFEAGIAGIPMLTFPMAGDQFTNGKLVVEDWKVGWRLRKQVGANYKLVAREAIAETVKTFMDINGSDRKELTERAKQFRQTIQRAIAKGGSSDTNIDAFIMDITQGHAHP